MTAPAPFDQLDATADDSAIAEQVSAAGAGEVVRAGVLWLQERFDAVAAGGIDGVIQWDVSDGADRHRWQLVVADGDCNVVAVDGDGSAEARSRPHVTLAAPVVEFVRVVGGVADLMERFTAGHVLIAGNLPLARATARWFPR